MNILENISLKPYNTFGIDVSAKQFISVNDINELKEILRTVDISEIFILSFFLSEREFFFLFISISDYYTLYNKH